MDEKQERAKKTIALLFKIPKVWLLCAGLVLALLIVILYGGVLGKEDKKEVITESTLKKIIEVSELSTYEAMYNGIAKVANEKKTDEIDYYVSYKAKVKAGIDFEQIKINVDNENMKISVTIPEIEITEVDVDIASFDYIIKNKKVDKQTISEAAYKECIKDVEKETSKNDAIYDLAKQNAKNIIEALITPFVEQVDSEYALEIN